MGKEVSKPKQKILGFNPGFIGFILGGLSAFILSASFKIIAMDRDFMGKLCRLDVWSGTYDCGTAQIIGVVLGLSAIFLWFYDSKGTP